MPLNLTVSVTRACNSRCRTCGIWCSEPSLLEPGTELTLDEYERLFASIGRGSVYFLNISGGEPTLRDDLAAIIESGARLLEPAHVHLPTNGLDPGRVVDTVGQILAVIEDRDAVLSVKPSIDGIGPVHDRIRGIEGNYDRVMETLERLLELRGRHPGRLEVGCGTVLSRLNLDEAGDVVRMAETLDLDSIIHEIAENREEMGNESWAITPSAAEYARAVRPFAAALRQTIERSDAMGALKAALRLRMIPLTMRWLRTSAGPLRCYAGSTNAHVGPRGRLWACAVQARANRMADLRQMDMDFREAWSGTAASRVRRRIRSGECGCPLANQMYANILLDPLELAGALSLVSRIRKGA
ncbi:MAG: radical SAM protein [Deltaproteobacteria bacterium]|nr:radical SAM protein [Deltaproteobacteria bacterium]